MKIIQQIRGLKMVVFCNINLDGLRCIAPEAISNPSFQPFFAFIHTDEKFSFLHIIFISCYYHILQGLFLVHQLMPLCLAI